MYSTKTYVMNAKADGYLCVNDPYGTKKERDSREKGAQLMTNSHHEMFKKFTYTPGQYDDTGGYLKKEPLDNRKLGFGTHDAMRRDEFTSHIRTEQYRATLNRENMMDRKANPISQLERRIEALEVEAEKIEQAQGKRPAVTKGLDTVSAVADEDVEVVEKFKRAYLSFLRKDRYRCGFLDEKTMIKMLAFYGLYSDSTQTALAKADKDFNGNASYLEVCNFVRQLDHPSIPTFKQVLLAPKNSVEQVPYQLYDIGQKAGETKSDLHDKRDIFYKASKDRAKRHGQHTVTSSRYGCGDDYDVKFSYGNKQVTSQFFDKGHLNV